MCAPVETFAYSTSTVAAHPTYCNNGVVYMEQHANLIFSLLDPL